jgi:hypothetical protein
VSIEELANITPVNPPIVNRKMNPIAHRSEGFGYRRAPYKVPSHLKILIPVGIAIIMVAEVK